jgi:hypothetical protein
MKRIVLPFLGLLAYLGFIGFGASLGRDSSLPKTLDLSLLAVSVGLGSVFSVLDLMERFGHSKSSSMVLLRIRRWWTDDPSLTK